MLKIRLSLSIVSFRLPYGHLIFRILALKVNRGNIMKIASYISVLLTLFLMAPSHAWADVFVYPLPDEQAGYAQPYPQQNHVQLMQHAQSNAVPLCTCPYPYAQSTAAQPPAPSPPPVTQASITREDRTVYFGFGKTRMSNAEKEKLNSLTNRLISANNVTNTYIVGYADRIGSVTYNEKLSRKRADNVRNYLIDRSLIRARGIETRWVGKSQASTRCSKHLPRAELLSCLQPDRKVEVYINYQTQTWPQPQIQPLY
jgi:outer membrane protein OmpA-like peptidoglycan-associated protein